MSILELKMKLINNVFIKSKINFFKKNTQIYIESSNKIINIELNIDISSN